MRLDTLHRLLANHEQVMWLSGFTLRFPDRPEWNRWAVTAMDNPLVRRLFGGKIRPGESYRFWDRYAYGFSEPCRDLVRSDVSARVKKQLRQGLRRPADPERHRLLLKITGWSRLGYLNEVFEDARFIHMMRDGRAVASSLLHVNFWRGLVRAAGVAGGAAVAGGPGALGELRSLFHRAGRLEWRIQMRAMDAAREQLDPSLPRGEVRGFLRAADARHSGRCSTSPSCRRRLGWSAPWPRPRSGAPAIGGATTSRRRSR